ILVNRDGKTWVVNYSRTGQGLSLGDFAGLEAKISLELLAYWNLESLYQMATRLLSISLLGEDADGAGLAPEIQKAILVTNEIRRFAARLSSQVLKPYLIVLLFWVTQRLIKYDPDLIYPRYQLFIFFHSLLLAAMICEKIAPPAIQPADLPPQALDGIWIDEENQAVWVEGHLVELTSLEYLTLLYLYLHKNKLCRRADIIEEVYNVSYTPDVSEGDRKILEKDRIETLVSRLRSKISPVGSRTKYIKTVRGTGYRLELVEY
ncbi:MAG: helix-turn-helix domain-containing protein, partial [Candidatus Promineifilaceae bacterium]